MPLVALWDKVKETAGIDMEPLEQLGAYDYVAQISGDQVPKVVMALGELGRLHHLSAITATKNDGALWLLYHLWVGNGLTLRVPVPADGTGIPTLRRLCPVADWYEREAHELYGITFEGHEDPKPLLLTPAAGASPPMLGQDDNR